MPLPLARRVPASPASKGSRASDQQKAAAADQPARRGALGSASKLLARRQPDRTTAESPAGSPRGQARQGPLGHWRGVRAKRAEGAPRESIL